MPEALGTVGRYEVLDRIGRGGMAVVYLARQTDLDRFVALKQLKVLDDEDPSYAERFIRESRVGGSLGHPNIVAVFDYFEHEGTAFIAMELVRGGSLRQYVGHMTLAQVGGVLEGLLAGLAHAEEEGIVHRDLKPENVMVTSDGRVKIADFGIAKATTKLHTGAFKTATGITVGTPMYMAPEQAMAQEVGPWTDLYSVGCMAFELFAGRPPFHDSDAPMAVLLRHVNERIPPVRSVEPSVDVHVSDWIERLLLKDPKQRTRSAARAWEDFEEILIELIGPRWRREARLRAVPGGADTPRPLTPAAFAEPANEGDASDEFGSSDEFETFAPGAATPPSSVLEPYTPPPHDLPPGPMQPPSDTDAEPYETYEEPPPPRPETPVQPPVDQPPPPPSPPDQPAVEPPPVDKPPARVPSRSFPATTMAPAGGPPVAAEPPPSRDLAAARRRTALALAAGVVLLGALAYVLAPSHVKAVPSRPDQPVTAQDVRFSVPGDWQTVGDVPAIEGLDLRAPTAAAPMDAPAGEAVLAGLTSATDPSLLPAAFVSTVLNPRIEPAPVRIAAGPALLYEDLRTRDGGAPLTILALPTAAGVATLACRGAPGSQVDGACRAIAQTFAPRSALVYSPPPRTAYADAVNRAIGRMAQAEADARAASRRATTARALGRALDDLAAAYRTAARAIGQIETAPYEARATRSIQTQLERLAGTYASLSDAAERRLQTNYETARRAAGTARADLRRRLERLEALGYEVNERRSA